MSAQPDPYQEHRELLSPQEVRQLSVLKPARAIVDTFFCWACIAAAWTLVASHPVWWSVLLAVPIIGNRFYALTIIAHDGFHGRLLEDRRRNDLFNDLCILGAVGAVTHLNKANHLRHHRHLATQNDPDRHRHGCFNKYDRLRLALFLSGISVIGRSLANVFGSRRNAIEEPKAKHNRRDLLIIGGWQVGLLAGLTWSIGWWAFPVLWLMPLYLFTFLADNFRSFAEHSHPEGDDEADEHRLTTFLSPAWERALFSPMNMNYHAVHHIWPSIPYYNLPAADAIVKARNTSHKLEWRYSYLDYLKRYNSALPLPECQPK